MLEEEDEEEYEVERILGHELRGGSTFFFVKWKGFESIWNSWEPEGHLENSPAILNDYKRLAGLTTTEQAASTHRPGRQPKPPKPRAKIGPIREVLGWKPGCTREDIVYVVRLMDNSLSELQSSIVAKSDPEKVLDFYEKLVDGPQMPPPTK
jgi:hypothetical protein